MKKFRSIISVQINFILAAIFILSTFIFIGCTDCSLNYEKCDLIDRVNIYYGQKTKECFVGSLDYGKDESTYFVIPSTHANKPVTTLGGYFGTGCPTPFQINVRLDGFFTDENNVFYCNQDIVERYAEDGYQINYIDLNFTIKLPASIKNIKNVLIDFLCKEETEHNGNKKLTVIRTFYILEIDNSSEYFYTIEGKLYNKKTNELIKDFLYC